MGEEKKKNYEKQQCNILNQELRSTIQGWGIPPQT